MKYFTAVIAVLFAVLLLAAHAVKKNNFRFNNGENNLMQNTKTIYLAGGCFWGMQKLMDSLEGVVSTTVGYANGNKEIIPDYKLVCGGNTGYKETVKVDYNPENISLENILKAYFYVIDPSVENKQGLDTGTQYQTGVYYIDEADLPVINAAADEVRQARGVFKVQIEPLTVFYPAEEYHQKYLQKNPNGYCHISEGQISVCSLKFGGKEGKAEYSKPSDAHLRKKLTPEQYEVTQNAATEPPFKNKYWDFFKKGIYVDVVTGQPLFSSEDKYKSTSGWPSFSAPIESEAIIFREDNSHSMQRTEALSKSGNTHLGHIFEGDLHSPTGTRYCINSASLRFIPYEDLEKEGYAELKKHFKQ